MTTRIHVPTDICLIGAGTVGRAILDDLISHGFSVTLVDQNADCLAEAERQIQSHRLATCQPFGFGEADLVAMVFMPSSGSSTDTAQTSDRRCHRLIVIESVPENLALKQSLFETLTSILPNDAVLATNTSNLRVNDIFGGVADNDRCCGLHFFMPVSQRPLIEFIPALGTSSVVHEQCRILARGLGKQLLVTADSPGFVVNRLLVPYLNQSLVLLQHGASAKQLQLAAEHFGMPLSPLALIDTIGTRTAFDSGRIFWQSFPRRLDPSPILPGMIKAKRWGFQSGGGFFDSISDATASTLNPIASSVIDRYRRESQTWSVEELAEIIGLTMWLEAAEVLATKVVSDEAAIELAVHGGLGYHEDQSFFGFIDSIPLERIQMHLKVNSKRFHGLRSNDMLSSLVAACSRPSDAVRQFASTWGERTS